MRASSLLSLVAMLFLAAACQSPPISCGRPAAGGGPAVIHYQDERLCELVRHRVLRWMRTGSRFTIAESEQLWEASDRWKYEDTIDELVQRVRKDGDDALAGAVRRAADDVLAESRPADPDCPEVQKCLVLGAVKGGRMALAQRGYHLRSRRTGEPLPPRKLDSGNELDLD